MGDRETIYVIEGDLAVAESLRTFFELKGVSVQVHATGEELLALPVLADVGCVITDLRLPKMQGLDIHKELFWRGSDLSLIGISDEADSSACLEMIMHGAVAILVSPPDLELLWSTVNDALKKSLSQHLAHLKSKGLRERLMLLTESERQVMKYLLQGHSHKSIASTLDLSLRSVDRRRQSLLQKTGVPSIQELVANLAQMQIPD